MELYWGSGSPYAWRVMLALEVKGLAYEGHLLSFSKREQRTPEYLALNPRGKVPTLRDGDVVLRESLAIMTYLDRKYPEPPLFGRTAQETGLIWQGICEFGSYMLAPGDELTQPLYFGLEGKVEQVKAAAAVLHGELARLETLASRGPWLAGDAVSALDLVIYPGIASLCRAAGKEAAAPLELGFLPLQARYPHLARWKAQVEQLPGFDRTYPPHWRT
jgi:glutathione S-transferase